MLLDLVAFLDARVVGDVQAGGFGDGDDTQTLPSSLLRSSPLLESPVRGESPLLFYAEGAPVYMFILSKLLTMMVTAHPVRHLMMMTMLMLRTIMTMLTMMTRSVHVIGRGTFSKAGMSASAPFV